MLEGYTCVTKERNGSKGTYLDADNDNNSENVFCAFLF
jgi:hypothetical protein